MDHVSVLSVSMWCYYEDQYTIGLAITFHVDITPQQT